VNGDRHSEPASPTDSVSSIPMEANLAPPQARLYTSTLNSSAPSLTRSSPQTSRRNSIDVPSNSSPLTFPLNGVVKTLSNRGSAIVSVHLSEPVLFLTGFEPQEYTERSPAILRGTLILKLLKPAKIKSVTLTFKGRARTEWPEGIPPKKAEFFEETELMTHAWTFFNAQFNSSESSHGADAARIIDSQRLSMDLSRASLDSVSSLALSDVPSFRSSTPNASPNLGSSPSSLAVPNGGQGLWGIPFGQSRSFTKEDRTATQVRGYRNFAAGEYMYIPSSCCSDV
jgi:arrestin-related trafficking adapter 3/6